MQALILEATTLLDLHLVKPPVSGFPTIIIVPPPKAPYTSSPDLVKLSLIQADGRPCRYWSWKPLPYWTCSCEAACLWLPDCVRISQAITCSKHGGSNINSIHTDSNTIQPKHDHSGSSTQPMKPSEWIPACFLSLQLTNSGKITVYLWHPV